MLSGSAGMALTLSAQDGSYRIDESGVSGYRASLSYLTLYKGYEQGLNIGIGLTENDNSDFIIGYDIRKVKAEAVPRPYRYGLYIESNVLQKGSDYGIQGGNVFQLRPYVMTLTSERENWYGGVHALMSFGRIEGQVDYWDSNYYQESFRKYEYDVSSVGLGASFGNETRILNLLVQSQIDISIVNQHHTLQGSPPDDYDNEWKTLEDTSPIVGFGLAVRIAPPRETPKPFYPRTNPTRPTAIRPRPKSAQKVKYDPFTGQKITETEAKPELQFDPETGEALSSQKEVAYDPLTGEPVVESAPVMYDPLTGEPLIEEKAVEYDSETGEVIGESIINNEEPYSLLSAQEIPVLLLKPLNITTLNGASKTAMVRDLMNTGVLIHGVSGQVIFPYDKIIQIEFQGPKRGAGSSFSSACVGCGASAAIGFGGTIILGADIFALGIIGAPVVGIVSWIVKAGEREHYSLMMTTNSTGLSDSEYRKEVILSTIRAYIQTGSLPKNKPTKKSVGGIP